MRDDLISRQVAIDAYGDWYVEEGTADGFIGTVKQLLEGLPSAQPEIIRCKDCKYGVNFYRDGECYCSNPKCELRYFGGSWEFYCADAERREQ